MKITYLAATLSHLKEKIKTASKCNLCQKVSQNMFYLFLHSKESGNPLFYSPTLNST